MTTVTSPTAHLDVNEGINNNSNNDANVEEVAVQRAPPTPNFFSWIRSTPAMRQYYEQRVLDSFPLDHTLEQIPVDFGDAGNTTHYINSVSIESPDGASKDKPHLLLLHGMGAGLGIWMMNISRLAEKYHVHAIDIIGFGGSSRPSFSTNSHDDIESVFVTSIEAWRESKGIDKLHILGHSFGGYIAGLYALQHHDRLHHIIFADPWGFNKKPENYQSPWRSSSFVIRGLVKQLKKLPPLAAIRIAGPWGGKLVRLRKDIGSKVEDFVEPEVFFEYLYHSNALPPSAELAFSKLSRDLPWADRPFLERIADLPESLPVTLLEGSHSWMRKSGDHLSQVRPANTYVRTINGAGHHVMWDNPDEFDQYVGDAASVVRQCTV